MEEDTFIQLTNFISLPNLLLSWRQGKVIGGVFNTFYEERECDIVMISTIDESTVEFTKFFVHIFNLGAELVDTKDLAKY